jgi:hypothetical protein
VTPAKRPPTVGTMSLCQTGNRAKDETISASLPVARKCAKSLAFLKHSAASAPRRPINAAQTSINWRSPIRKRSISQTFNFSSCSKNGEGYRPFLCSPSLSIQVRVNHSVPSGITFLYQTSSEKASASRAEQLACIAHKSYEICERCRLWQQNSPSTPGNSTGFTVD